MAERGEEGHSLQTLSMPDIEQEGTETMYVGK
jgi:hypothetical protein